jgi:ABC-type transport system substrate-binding protein
MGLLINDPSDVLNQVYAFDVEKNPDNWTTPEFGKLVDAQISELDPAERQAQFEGMVDILRKGESHWIPIVWESMGGAHDYRIQNYHVPQTIQQVLKWEHIWWDPDAVCPDPAGCEQ